MDRVVGNALKRRTELRHELAEVERFLALYEQFKGVDYAQQPSFAVVMEPQVAVDSVPRDGSESERIASATVAADIPSSSSVKGLSKLELKPYIEEVIKEAGRPLTRGQLLRKLDAKNVLVGGQADRSKNMGTIMWRLREDFVNLSGHGYWMRHTPYPAANYEPQGVEWDEMVIGNGSESSASDS